MIEGGACQRCLGPAHVDFGGRCAQCTWPCCEQTIAPSSSLCQLRAKCGATRVLPSRCGQDSRRVLAALSSFCCCGECKVTTTATGTAEMAVATIKSSASGRGGTRYAPRQGLHTIRSAMPTTQQRLRVLHPQHGSNTTMYIYVYSLLECQP